MAQWAWPLVTPQTHIPCPTLYRTFSCGAVQSATLHITGLGLYRAHLNGCRVGEDYLTPGCNDYDAYLRYQTYDVTALVRAENRIEVTLGDGWYRGRFGMRGKTRIFGDRYLLSACLTLVYPDGSEEHIVTDGTWQAVRSPIVESSLYDGETRDDTRGPGCPAPCVTAEPPCLPEPAFSPPVRCVETRTPTLLVSPAGERILDFGQNMAGVVRFTNRLPRGGTLRLQFGEVLQNGCFYRENLRTARAEYVYTSDGTEKAVEPFFTYYGFRYAKVEGLDAPDPADFTALALSSSLRRTLTVETDSPKIDRLLENVYWGQRSNFVDVPTDCPQRDERLGWTADTQVFANTACYQMDCKAFYRKVMRDMRADQTRYYGGDIPMYSPSLRGECGAGGAVWADAATILPWQVYRHYGDRALLSENYPMMRDYAETRIREDMASGGGHILRSGFCFGDWLALDGATPTAMKGGTDDTFLRTVYYGNSVRLTGLAAAELGHAADAARYAALWEEIRMALLDEFVTPNGRLAVDTQTGYVLALAYGVWRDRGKLAAGLGERLKKDGFVLKTGFAGTPLLLPVLFDNGFSDAAYRMLYREAFPGWLYQVDLGATTVWERWNSLLPDGSVSETGMNSLNHYAYGSVAEAVYSRIAGLQCGAPGWKTARIAPRPNGRMRRIHVVFDSPAGRYAAGWELHADETLTVRVSVPEGAAAELRLPDHPDNGTHALAAGEHAFTYRPTADYLHPFSGDTPVCDLLEHGEASRVLADAMPQLYAMLREPDCALTAESLRALAQTLPFVDAAETEKAVARLTRVRR